MSKEDKFVGLVRLAYNRNKINKRQYDTLLTFVKPDYEVNEILYDFIIGLYNVDGATLVSCLVRMN